MYPWVSEDVVIIDECIERWLDHLDFRNLY